MVDQNKTEQEYYNAISNCRSLFEKKLKDYGAAWRILRSSSLTDQLLIKASRIRSIEIKNTQKVDDNIEGEFIGLVNYGVIGIIQLRLGTIDQPDMTSQEALQLYDETIDMAFQLMMDKNHDYDEAWRMMRVSSFTDLILSKIYRTKQIESNDGKTIVSEGIDANYMDIINYSVFALIKLSGNEA